jgi:hypothetical protein
LMMRGCNVLDSKEVINFFEMRGDGGAGVRHSYRDFLTLWKDADPRIRLRRRGQTGITRCSSSCVTSPRETRLVVASDLGRITGTPSIIR